MREMDRKDFNLSFDQKLMFALGSFGPGAFGVFIVVENAKNENPNAAESLHWSFYGVAVLMFVWAGTNLNKPLADEPPITFTRDFAEERYFGFGQISWDDVLSVEPHVENRKMIQYRTIFVEVKKPEDYLNAVSFYTRLFLPLRTWRKRLLPLYFGAFHKRFDEALVWVQTYKPDIPIRWPEEQ